MSAEWDDPWADQFWLILHEPGRVPELKAPWPDIQTKAVLREFIAARPMAYIDVLTVDRFAGPQVEHGPEVLQMADGRSMSVSRRHNATTRAAHAEHHAAAAGDRSRPQSLPICSICRTGPVHAGWCPTRNARSGPQPPPWANYPPRDPAPKCGGG